LFSPTAENVITYQGTAIDSKIANPVILYLEKNGKVKGEKSEGTWECHICLI